MPADGHQEEGSWQMIPLATKRSLNQAASSSPRNRGRFPGEVVAVSAVA